MFVHIPQITGKVNLFEITTKTRLSRKRVFEIIIIENLQLK